MEYNNNSFGFKYNRFANFSNPYFNNIIPNPVNQTTNQCFQCSDQPFIRTIIQSNANSCHITSPYNPRKCNLQKRAITASTPQTSSSSGKLSSTFTIDSILETNKDSAKDIKPSIHSSKSNLTYLDINQEVVDTGNETIYNWLNCSRYKPPKVTSKSNGMHVLFQVTRSLDQI